LEIGTISGNRNRLQKFIEGLEKKLVGFGELDQVLERFLGQHSYWGK